MSTSTFPTPEAIQDAALFWAERLGDQIVLHQSEVFSIKVEDKQSVEGWRWYDPEPYVADRRTCARARDWARNTLDSLPGWRDEDATEAQDELGSALEVWISEAEEAWANPTAALVELARAVREVEAK